MNIYEKLSYVQSKLVAPKNQFNKFGNYKYRSCEDILTAVKPLLEEHKLSLTLTDNIVQIGDRFYVNAIAKLYDADGNCIENSAFAREDESKKGMDGSQLTGSTSSYARKYALNGLFAIDDNADADTDEYHKQTGKATKTESQTKPVIKCPNCGKPVTKTKIKGEIREPEAILEACGGVCVTCYKQAKKEEKNNSMSDVEEIK